MYLSIAKCFNCIDSLTDEANILSANSSFRYVGVFIHRFPKIICIEHVSFVSILYWIYFSIFCKHTTSETGICSHWSTMSSVCYTRRAFCLCLAYVRTPYDIINKVFAPRMKNGISNTLNIEHIATMEDERKWIKNKMKQFFQPLNAVQSSTSTHIAVHRHRRQHICITQFAYKVTKGWSSKRANGTRVLHKNKKNEINKSVILQNENWYYGKFKFFSFHSFFLSSDFNSFS